MAFLAAGTQLALMKIGVTLNAIIVYGLVMDCFAGSSGEAVCFFQMAFLAAHIDMFAFQRIV